MLNVKRVVLRSRPENVRVNEIMKSSKLKEGQVLVRMLFLSVDPYMRCCMNDDTGADYLLSWRLEECVDGGGVGVVEASKNQALSVGAIITSFSWPWQTYSVMDGSLLQEVDPEMADGHLSGGHAWPHCSFRCEREGSCDSRNPPDDGHQWSSWSLWVDCWTDESSHEDTQETLRRKNITRERFVVLNYMEKREEGLMQLSHWVKTGQIKVLETVVIGIENIGEAFCSMMTGGNIGKQVVKISD